MGILTVWRKLRSLHSIVFDKDRDSCYPPKFTEHADILFDIVMKNLAVYVCCGTGCASADYQQKWPRSHFIKEDLIHAQLQGVSARCARCQIMEDKNTQRNITCKGCEQSKHITMYSAVVCKQFLQGVNGGRGFRCNECQFPKCALCDNRPEKAISPNHLEPDGKWYCRKHRYPPCSICRVAERPLGYQKSKVKFKEWICSTCTTKDHETPAGTEPVASLTTNVADSQQSQNVRNKNSRASMKCQLPFCGKSHPDVNFKDRRAQACNSCEYPRCKNCGSQRPMTDQPLYAGLHRTKLTERIEWYCIDAEWMDAGKNGWMDGWIGATRVCFQVTTQQTRESKASKGRQGRQEQERQARQARQDKPRAGKPRKAWVQQQTSQQKACYKFGAQAPNL